MNFICKWLRPREEVLLYDNGLRIESTIRILSNDKWRARYVVCQRKTATEAPLIGIFKNDRAREKGDHIDLFYLQNYIGYEYGFKFKKTNKTLAVLIQGQTLVFSFFDVEHMVFWKEWLKDVCGRSAMFFMSAGIYPQNTSIIRLRSKEVRIHITRLALVIVQDVPPNQCLFLCLEDLFDVQCYENRFVFRALAYSWSYPHEFLFYCEQVPELSLKLQCILKAKQFYNHQKNSIDPSRFSAPVNAMGKASVCSGSASFSQEEKKRNAYPPISAPPSFSNASEHQRSADAEINEKFPLVSFSNEEKKVIYGNGSVKKPTSDTPSLLQRPSTLSMQQIAEVLRKPVNANAQAHPILENEFDPPTQKCSSEFRYENYANSSGNEVEPTKEPTNTYKKSEAGQSNNISTFSDLKYMESEEETEGSYAVLCESRTDVLAEPKSRRQSPIQFALPPAQFLNSPTQNDAIMSGAQLPGLIKPYSNVSLNTKSFGRGLSKSLKKSVRGSYKKYDGEKAVHEYSDLDESVFNLPQMKMTNQRAPLPVNNLVNLPPPPIHSDSNFESSINSSVRINSAIQKGRERMKQTERRTSKFSSSNTSHAAEDSGKSDDESTDAVEGVENKQFTNHFAKRIQPTMTLKQDMHDRLSHHSVSTLANKSSVHSFDGSCADTVCNQNTPLALSKAKLEEDDLINSSTSLPLARAHSPNSSENSLLADSISVCSELNSRVLFQRGGRSRTSGHSVKSKKTSPPPPPLPMRQQLPNMRSLQQMDSRKGWNTPSLFSSIMDDYVELDAVPSRKTSQRPIAAVAPLNAFEHRKLSVVQFPTAYPAHNRLFESEIDYVSICPTSTKALEKLSSNRAAPPSLLKKSNSVCALNRQYSAGTSNSTKRRQQIEDDDDDTTSASLSFATSGSHLSHLLSKARNNFKARGGDLTLSSSIHNINQ